MTEKGGLAAGAGAGAGAGAAAASRGRAREAKVNFILVMGELEREEGVERSREELMAGMRLKCKTSL